MAATVPFVIGFTIVFALAGAAAGAFGGAADAWRPVLIKAAGLHASWPWASRSPACCRCRSWSAWSRRRRATAHAARRCCSAAPSRSASRRASGPVLASLLALASSQETAAAGRGAARGLLARASPCRSSPSGAAYGHAMGAFRWLRDRQDVVRAVSGAVLVAFGLLLFFDRLWWLNVPLNRSLTSLGLDGLPRL